MKITNSNTADISEIFRLYRLATAFQKTKRGVQWPEFSAELVSKEIAESRQWKIMVGKEMACVWAVTYEDPEIWGEKVADKDWQTITKDTKRTVRNNNQTEGSKVIIDSIM